MSHPRNDPQRSLALVHWPPGKETGHQDLWIWRAISMHIPPSTALRVFATWQRNMSQLCLYGEPYQCTGHQRIIDSWQRGEGQVHQKMMFCSVAMHSSQHSIACVGHMAKRKGNQDVWIWCAISMPRATARHYACLPHGKEQGPPGFGVWCAISIHRPSAQHCMCWTDGRDTCKHGLWICLLYTSPSPRDAHESRMPSSA